MEITNTLILEMQKRRFIKSQHPFIIKTLSKLGREENVLSLVGNIYYKSLKTSF